ncbi:MULTISPECIES: dihydroorotase [unclassified Acinetobacter]|uniref:dihydroorotase n=1 Tax=unclassified Acinetobacter TaxID=196816 RepID=UPI0035B7A044
MNSIQIKNVRLINPMTQTEQVQDVYVQNGKLVEKLDNVSQVIDATGQWLMPTMVDLCANLREPGQQQHGTLQSEGIAAREQGILHVVIPPDCKPIVQDNGALIQGLKEKAWQDAGIYLHITGALTQGLEGKQPSNMAGLQKGGCLLVSNAYAAFENDDVILRTLEYAAGLDLTVVFYPEEPQIAKDGCVHQGFTASRQGLPTIPTLAETVALAKYLLMVEATGVKAHFGLLSCGASVDLIRIAKEKGLNITADVAIHQLHLTDDVTDGFNTLAHVRPPLRSAKDRDLLREGVASGVIDAICSHHEPLNASAKQAPFAETQAGISAFDSFVALGVALVEQGLLSPLQWTNRVTTQPANIANIADAWAAQHGWVLIDPNAKWTLNAENIRSKGKNTPLIGAEVQGKVVQVFA